MGSEATQATVVRPLRQDDLAAVMRIDSAHTGAAKPAYWRRLLARSCGRGAAAGTVALGAAGPAGLVGYLIGEVREVEFGSAPCGWIFAIGVDAAALRGGVATLLLRQATRRFAELGVAHLRTMVARNDVPVLSFFRSSGFVGGPYVQLDLPIGEPEVWR